MTRWQHFVYCAWSMACKKLGARKAILVSRSSWSSTYYMTLSSVLGRNLGGARLASFELRANVTVDDGLSVSELSRFGREPSIDFQLHVCTSPSDDHYELIEYSDEIHFLLGALVVALVCKTWRTTEIDPFLLAAPKLVTWEFSEQSTSYRPPGLRFRRSCSVLEL